MEKISKYVAKYPGSNGQIPYTQAEHEVWQALYTRQMPIVQTRACDKYLQGLALLDLAPDHIPQCDEVSAKLAKYTGWGVEPVPALISFTEFYKLLARNRFPAASFIRAPEDLDYIQEPDIFHEIFGHCPMLTDPAFANFSQRFGEIGLATPKEQRMRLQRLYWFTVEFGLSNTEQGVRAYGGGILSSIGETQYALESSLPTHKAFDVMQVLRTPYRYDQMQKTYYVIDKMEDFYHFLEQDIPALLAEASRLGDLPLDIHGAESEEDLRSC